MVTFEDEDGCRFDDPELFDDKADAEAFAKSCLVPDGITATLYRCHDMGVLQTGEWNSP